MTQTWRRDIATEFNRFENLVGPIFYIRSLSEQHFNDKMAIRKLFHNLSSIVSAINSEEVKCRRHNKRSKKYQELLDKFDETSKILEEMLVMFKLMY